MVELVQPKWYERLLVLTVQGVFFNGFFVYIFSPPNWPIELLEEAVYSYTEYLKEIDSGAIENVPAPAIAIDYWKLPKDATLKDVIIVIRADEAHHRDVNHFAAVRAYHLNDRWRRRRSNLGRHWRRQKLTRESPRSEQQLPLVYSFCCLFEFSVCSNSRCSEMFNVTDRLVMLFPRIDVDPTNGFVIEHC
ncbi:ubiquinol oxidase [Quercus suber]|uniref:Ubiquinol oxidase n=1 Tax=Quercus suber TaxID=58331 RepID=A0AAW0JX66_QUESU